MYGFCNICQAVVTPLTKVHREIYNFSFAKFMKILFFNHKLTNRTEEDFNIFNTNKYPFVKNNCNHFINKDISRVFMTHYGAVKFTYENCSIYLVEPCALLDTKENQFYSTLDETQFTSFTSKSGIALKYLTNYYNHLNSELDCISSIFTQDENSKNLLLNLKEKVLKQNDKMFELINFCTNFPTFKTEDIFRMCLIKKKLNARIIQIKIIFQKLSKNFKVLKKFVKIKLNTTLQRLKESFITTLNYDHQ